MKSLYNIIKNIFKIEEDCLCDDLGPGDIEAWDSLGQMNLIAAIEKEFGFKFEIAEMFEIYTIGDIKTILERKGVAYK